MTNLSVGASRLTAQQKADMARNLFDYWRTAKLTLAEHGIQALVRMETFVNPNDDSEYFRIIVIVGNDQQTTVASNLVAKQIEELDPNIDEIIFSSPKQLVRAGS